MSSAVLPALPGLAWNITRKPRFKTNVYEANSGREVRTTMQVYPLYDFLLPYEFLRASSAYLELQLLEAFFLSRQGSLDSFLYTDTLDCSVTDAQFGVGTGAQTQFQLTRPFGSFGVFFSEPVQNVNVLTNIKKAGVAQTSPTNYSISSTGLVTFVSAPASGAALTWSGTYYYRCRFLEDEFETNNFMQYLWEHGGLKFTGAPGNRVGS